jgi:hypothetical protein
MEILYYRNGLLQHIHAWLCIVFGLSHVWSDPMGICADRHATAQYQCLPAVKLATCAMRYSYLQRCQL